MSERHTRDQENKQRGPGTAPKGTKLPPQLGPAAVCSPVRTPDRPPTRAAPPQRHGRRRMAAARPAAATQERRRAADTTLRRQLPREPYPSAPTPRARVQPRQHAQLPAEPAHGSQLAPPPPLAPPAARHRHPSHSTSLMRPRRWTIELSIRPPLSAVLREITWYTAVEV